MSTRIDTDEIRRRLDAGEPLVLVETLPEKYFRAGHLPGALNLPHDRIAALAPDRLPDREREIVVYCAGETCRNSAFAAGALDALGYRRVREYVGGKAAWEAAGHALEGARAAA